MHLRTPEGDRTCVVLSLSAIASSSEAFSLLLLREAIPLEALRPFWSDGSLHLGSISKQLTCRKVALILALSKHRGVGSCGRN